MGKRQQLLFELIHKEKESTSPFSVKVQPQLKGESLEDGSENAILKTSRFVIVNPFTITIAITTALVIFFCGYILGYKIGKDRGIAHRSDAQLAMIKKAPPQENLLTINQQVYSEESQDHSSPKENTPTQKEISDLEEGNIKRQPGLNYLIIQLFKDYEDAKNAYKFLTEKGIKVTIEKLSKWYALTSIAGFDFKDPESRKQAEEFREQIKALGRIYVKQREAKGVDFQTCFYRKWR